MTGKVYPSHTLSVVHNSRWRKYDGPYALFYDLSDQNLNPLRTHALVRELDTWVRQSVERAA